MQHAVHSSSYGYIMPLWRIHLWILSPSCFHYMVIIMFFHLFIVQHNIIMLIMILFADIILAYMRIMIGGGTHGVDVFFGEEDPHTFCITCSKGSMGRDMASTAKSLFLNEEDHEMDGMPYGGDFLSIMYEMVWASLIHSAGRATLGGLVPFLPIEGNNIAAQDQKILYTHLKWRGR